MAAVSCLLFLGPGGASAAAPDPSPDGWAAPALAVLLLFAAALAFAAALLIHPGLLAAVLLAFLALAVTDARLPPAALAAALAFAGIGLLGVLGRLLLITYRQRPVAGDATLRDAEGEVVAWQGHTGVVRVGGVRWNATALTPLAVGTRVRIIARKGLSLAVEAKTDNP
jgi:membrane-bound serine protease (ClpP class)